MDDDLHPTPPEPPPVPPPPGAPPRDIRGLSSSPVAPTAPLGQQASGRIRLGALFMLIGGGIVLLSTFLPRFTITGPNGTTSLSGIQGGSIGMLVLAGFAIAKGSAGIRPGIVRMRLGSPILTGILMMVVLALRWSDLQNGLKVADGIPGVTASIGIGYWLSVLGAALVLCGGALLQFGDRVG
ncbi:MAG: hypothetical protein ABJC60_02300 [Actinomycetota bacterium]